jgi:hypothetical protein
MARPERSTRAQASIEMVALVPALALVLVAAAQALVAGWALVAAESASRAAARAVLVGRPARPAALAALPASMRAGTTVAGSDARVVVTVRVPSLVPGFTPSISAAAPVVRQ